MACYRFNPPYKNNVTTRMGQTFLHFADIKKKKNTFYTKKKHSIQIINIQSIRVGVACTTLRQ